MGDVARRRRPGPTRPLRSRSHSDAIREALLAEVQRLRLGVDVTELSDEQLRDLLAEATEPR
jgi:hypothetical protein